MGEIILLLRRTFPASTEMHRGEWNKSAAGAHEVRGLTLGIVGYGKIGSQLSDLAEAMGMRVVFYDSVARAGAWQCARRWIPRSAGDVGCGHAARRWQEGESGSVWRRRVRGDERWRVLPQSEPRVCGRSRCAGRVLEDRARLRAAAIDVFPTEPESGAAFKSALQGLPNVILTPHVGGIDRRGAAEYWIVCVGEAAGLCEDRRFDAEREPAAVSSGL